MRLHNLDTNEEETTKLIHISNNPMGELIKVITQKLEIVRRHRKIYGR